MKDARPLSANHEQVLRLLQAAGKPMTAYEILDGLRPLGIAAPPTVYRALTRLLNEGLVHRLESINAYVTCAITPHHHGATVFAICRDCGGVDELDEATLVGRLKAKAVKHGFTPDEAVIELKGQCALCAGAHV
jgi:Fur family zinc uptake transcriptional regulator